MELNTIATTAPCLVMVVIISELHWMPALDEG